MKPKIFLIVAYNNNRVIGSQGKIPWHFPSELKLFKSLTTNDTVIMGRKTWDSLPKKPLPNRTNLIISTTLPNGFSAIGNAIESCKTEVVWIIGGQQVYDQALQQNAIDLVIASEIENNVKGDAFFPELPNHWHKKTMIFEEKDKFKTFIYQKEGCDTNYEQLLNRKIFGSESQ